MNLIRELVRHHRPRRHLLVKSVLLLWVVRVGLWLVPFRIFRLLLAYVTRDPAGHTDGDDRAIHRVTWAVTKGSRFVPHATCLTQALTAQLMLSRRGHRPQLRIGVAKDEQGRLEAHAWLECEGKIVIGDGADRSRFSPLLPADRGRP